MFMATYFNEEVNNLTLEQLRSKKQSLENISTDFINWAKEFENAKASGNEIPFPSQLFWNKLASAGLTTKRLEMDFRIGNLSMQRFVSYYDQVESLILKAISNLEGKKVEVVQAKAGYIEDRIQTLSIKELLESEKQVRAIYDKAFSSGSPDFKAIFRELEEKGLITREMAADFLKGDFQRTAGRAISGVISSLRREAEALGRDIEREKAAQRNSSILTRFLGSGQQASQDPRVKAAIRSEGIGAKRSPIGRFCDWFRKANIFKHIPLVKRLPEGVLRLLNIALKTGIFIVMGPASLWIAAAFALDAISGNRKRAYGSGGAEGKALGTGDDDSLKRGQPSGRTQSQGQELSREAAEKLRELRSNGQYLFIEQRLLGESDRARFDIGYFPDGRQMDAEQVDQLRTEGRVYDMNSGELYFGKPNELMYAISSDDAYYALKNIGAFDHCDCLQLSEGGKVFKQLDGDTVMFQMTQSPFDGIRIVASQDPAAARRQALRDRDKEQLSASLKRPFSPGQDIGPNQKR